MTLLREPPKRVAERLLYRPEVDPGGLRRRPIVARLQDLPAMPSRLGRDIDLVVSGGGTNSRNDIVGAIERLRHVANYNNTPLGQTSLPGFESTDGTA